MIRRWPIWIAIMGGLGYLPAPGTFGSLPGIALMWALGYFFPNACILSLVILCLGFLWGIRVCRKAQELLHEKDPGKIVFDETIGMGVALLWIPFGWTQVILSFILFRIFDIAKPFGIRRSEAVYPKNPGVSVMLDDLIAGILANIAARIFLHVFSSLYWI